MSITAAAVGIPQPDKDGTLRVTHAERDGVVTLSLNGHAFVKCFVRDGDAIVQVIDVDTGVRCERNIQVLCWRR